MYIALISIIILACVLLTLVVLAQNAKGGGLSSQFGGAGTSQLMGVKRTGDLLEKLTWAFAIAVLALSLSSHMIIDRGNTADGIRSVNVDRAKSTPSSGPALPDNNLDATKQPSAPASEGQPAQQQEQPAETGQPGAVPAQ